ncbi:uncharacterized protein L969DRAFT_23380 [Mixia osmundae IAM 14324]|uniref:Exonuclease V, mitochondrial n=1 Tax=Mixia osmundae (strain CBS 9802 / IAM 14324 / JCM 22182 / KY 12970) TaxID=764103 RepID=G7E8Q1_MIXOS|nr:uncharacterized protein L969DRAFT_23380 [Mixia osmundae IAM 14324]KEI40155.1 hypothetical protein L969DRAFT_23380 [Mixia osmundae IAM 14324]GAA99519.1 hypothetical protein E5Q_06220 [Mixia osmundae IAM 14324]
MQARPSSDYGEDDLDLSALDWDAYAHCQPSREARSVSGQIEIEYERDDLEPKSDVLLDLLGETGPASDMALQATKEGARRSLFERFRSRGSLSATDFSGPSWCEYAFIYGMLGKRWLPVAERPTSIITQQGNTVKIDQKQTVRQQKILDAGVATHLKLERKVHPEVVKIETTSKVDAIALKLYRLIAALDSLLRNGHTREFPLFGRLDNFIVLGVADEIKREPILKHTTKTGTKRKGRRSDSSAQQDRTLHQFFSLQAKPEDKPAAPPVPTHRCLLTDTKTRAKSTALPAEPIRKASEMQLMIYKRLFDELRDDKMPWDDYLALFRLERESAFSEEFGRDMNALIGSAVETEALQRAKTLGDLINCIRIYFGQLEPIDPKLQLIYCLRQALDSPASSPAPEEPEMLAKRPRTRAQAAEAQLSSAEPPIARSKMSTSVGKEIGRHTFKYDADRLQALLCDRGQFWRSEREPRGVSIEETRKCHYCEFYNDCEWRNAQAERLTADIRSAKAEAERKRAQVIADAALQRQTDAETRAAEEAILLEHELVRTTAAAVSTT